MGYACPVCGHPQSDPRHLANHLAFTALARGGDHERWLDDHVPEWESLGETGLGDRVVDHADSVEFPQVFEDTTSSGSSEDHDHAGGGPDHSHDHAGEREESERDVRLDAARSRATAGAFSDDAADVLAQARELTRKRQENASGEGDSSGERDTTSDERREGDTGSDDEDGAAVDDEDGAAVDDEDGAAVDDEDGAAVDDAVAVDDSGAESETE